VATDETMVARAGGAGRMTRTLSRRGLVAGSAATAVAVSRLDALAAAGGARPETAHLLRPTAQEGGTLTYGLSGDFDEKLDPQGTNFDTTIRVTLNICEPLVWMPGATEIVPNLAESWEISPDGLAYTFTLRQGVTFHDGTPFTAEAVQFTFDRVVELDRLTAAATPGATPTADPSTVLTPGQSHDQLGPYDHSEIIDDHTIRVILSRPFTPFLSGLNGYLGIVSPTAVREMGLAEFNRHPVGTGPYMFGEWVEQDHVTLLKNPNYVGGSPVFQTEGQPHFDELIYRIIPDPAVRTGTLISGETQYIEEIDPLQIEDLRGNPELEVIEKPQPGSGWIVLFNMARTGQPQTELEVRQALSYAVDKDAFNQAIFGGLNVPAASPLMKPTFGYDPATEQIYSYDPERAASMLEAAGWTLNGDIREKNGQPLALAQPIQNRPQDNAMATFLQGSFREVGVDLQVEPLELAAARERRIAGLYDVGMLWFSYADPDILRAIFHSDNIGAFNRANYSNPEVDQWLDEAAASGDPEARAQLYSQIQIRVLEEAITLPLADSVVYNAKQTRLQGEILDYLASYVWMNDARFGE